MWLTPYVPRHMVPLLPTKISRNMPYVSPRLTSYALRLSISLHILALLRDLWYTPCMDDVALTIPQVPIDAMEASVQEIAGDNGEGVIVDVNELIEAVEASTREIVEEPKIPLTVQEEAFAFAMVEWGGNFKLAVKSIGCPAFVGRQMLLYAHVQERIKDLMGTFQDSCLISLGSHLMELADIRDTAKASGLLKVALEAERSRGEVSGLYAKAEANHAKAPMAIQINMVSKYDAHV